MSYITDFISEVKAEIAELESRYEAILTKYNAGVHIVDIKNALEKLFTDSRMTRFRYSDNEVVLPMFKEFINKVYNKLIEFEKLCSNSIDTN